MNDELKKLADLLEKRLEVIGDAELRESDPDRQLELLKEVSEDINSLHTSLQGRLKPRLAHFLESCSYQKALDWINSELATD